MKISDAIDNAQIRAISMISERVGKEVREAGMDWDPYFVIFGNEEVASMKLIVIIRKKSQPDKPFKEQMTSDALIGTVQEDTDGKLFQPLYAFQKLSMKALSENFSFAIFQGMGSFISSR
jgi:threonyl-tRNA synthetase